MTAQTLPDNPNFCCVPTYDFEDEVQQIRIVIEGMAGHVRKGPRRAAGVAHGEPPGARPCRTRCSGSRRGRTHDGVSWPNGGHSGGCGVGSC